VKNNLEQIPDFGLPATVAVLHGLRGDVQDPFIGEHSALSILRGVEGDYVDEAALGDRIRDDVLPNDAKRSS
jgi:hypothetical protein